MERAPFESACSEATLKILADIAGSPPADAARQYGLIDSILCLLGRSEFDADVPSADRALADAAAATSLAAFDCLLALVADPVCGLDVLEHLAQHSWAAHDVVCFVARGHPQGIQLLADISAASPQGLLAVSRALDDAVHAAAVYAEAHTTPAVAATLSPAREAVGLGPVELRESADGSCFRAEVRRLTRAAECAWQTLPWRCWPPGMAPRTKQEQRNAAESLQRLRAQTARPGITGSEKKKLNRMMAQIALDGTADFVDAMVEGGVFEQSKVFTAAARAGDARLCDADEFQAGRNAWACFGLQLVLLGDVADCNAAVVGYSMLYPYSDNLLDDPAMTRDAKVAFQQLFRQRLAGDASVPPPAGRTGELVWKQVALIESQWDREEHANVFHSLVAINDAQTHSLKQHVPPLEAKYGEILDITIEKGGTSVLADLFVSKGGKTTRLLAAYAFHLGVALQIVDDLQDVAQDVAAGQQTLFTVPSVLRGLHADAGAHRLAHLLTEVIRRPIEATASSATPAGFNRAMLQDGKLHMCLVTALKAIFRAPDLFSEACLAAAARRSPLPRAQMSKLAGMRTLMKMVKADAI